MGDKGFNIWTLGNTIQSITCKAVYTLKTALLKTFLWEFLLCLSGLSTGHRAPEDVGFIPGVTQWVKDLALLQSVVQVTDETQIWCCGSCGEASNYSSDSTPSLETSICQVCGHKKKKKILLYQIKVLYHYLIILIWNPGCLGNLKKKKTNFPG